jgi:ATP-binding cassette, subfamily B, multidrug efflux pump
LRFNPFKPFAHYIRPYHGQVALGLVLLFVTLAISLMIPKLLQWGIESIEIALNDGAGVYKTGSIEGDLAFYAGLIAGLSLLNWVLSIGMRYYLTIVSRKVERDIRRAYVNHLLYLPLSFFQESRVGDLMARATNDVEAIQRFLHHAFRMSLTGALTFVMALLLMCQIDWKLAVLSLLPMPVMVLVTRKVGEKVRSGYRGVQEQFAEMSARIQENLSGMRVVKAYALGDSEEARFAELNEEYVERNRRLVKIRALFFPFTFLLNGASMVVILWLGGLHVIDGSMSLGAFVAFNAYLIRMGRPMMLLGRIVDEYQRAVASMGRIQSVVDAESQALGGTEQMDIQGEIEFRSTTFSYDGRAALDGVQISVPAGSTLAIVGRVGAGKTTMARLLPRLIEAGLGELLIDGVPVDQIPLGDLRRAIGYVPQETFLFSDTLRENMLLGLEGAGDEEVEEAVEIAQLSSDLSSFPRGLETIVGERGVTLSGGQKQRTALARAVIRKPQILILDDALAAVDAKTEEQILLRLRGIMAERTTIIIAHRISTVKDADQIAVLDEGHLAELGTHGELVKKDGIYADMCRRQNLTSELEAL